MKRSYGHGKSDLVGAWAWFLPAAYVIHVADEAFSGQGLMVWMAAGGGARLSLTAFIGLNMVGAALLYLAAWAARRSTVLRWPLVSGATIICANGILHIVVCVMTGSLVPGIWTGFFLYVPLGGFLLFRLRRSMSPGLFAAAMVIGFLIHAIVLMLVLRIPHFHPGPAHASVLTQC